MELFENWQETKEALLEGLSDRKKAFMKPIMENVKDSINEAVTNGTAVGAVSNFQKIAIPMIRRIIPGTIASEIVGVQPMSGPVGLAYSLRFAYAEGLDVGAAGAGAEDIASGDEIFANNSKTRRFYSGGPKAGPANGFAASTDDYESYGGRSLKLEVLKQTVTAGSRKLQAKWSIEALQDLSSQHGLDLEAEITAALSAAITSEIDQEIVSDLVALAGTVETFDMSGAGFTGVPNYVGDRHAVLGVLVNKVANEIARKTRRGAGNFAVCSPVVISVLQSAAKSVFAPAVSGSFIGPNDTKLAGVLNGSIKMYNYIYADGGANSPLGAAADSDNILIGFKGGATEMDTGYFYCPYIPLMSSNVVIDPSTYNPQVSLMTRYGKATFTNTASSLGNSADYYGRITVKNLAFI